MRLGRSTPSWSSTATTGCCTAWLRRRRAIDLSCKFATFSIELGSQFLFGRKKEFVSAGEDLLVLMQNGIAHNRSILAGAENNPDGGVVVRRSFQFVRHTNVHVHLPNVLMGKLSGL